VSSAVPDVLGPNLAVIFCGINPGRVSAATGAHFANPRNDFWRLLHEAGFTPRLLGPAEQFEALGYGVGLTNAAFRTTPGSGDLRRGDFAGAEERLTRIALELRPRLIAFVGKEASRGAFGERPELGLQRRTLVDSGLFVLPSTSPANAAVPYAERLRWFRALKDELHVAPSERLAVRALVLDDQDRCLLLRWARPGGTAFWITPGGAIEAGETEEDALRRELREELGLEAFERGPCAWVCEFVFRAREGWYRQRERHYLVRVGTFEPAPEIDLRAEDVTELRWWTHDQLVASDEIFAPRRLPALVRDVLLHGPPAEPVDAGA
jgi:TDG/mug DNA glycosylase family protein